MERLPGSVGIEVTGIDAKGEMVSLSPIPDWQTNAVYTSIDAPLVYLGASFPARSGATAVNDKGDVVGFYWGKGDCGRGFLRLAGDHLIDLAHRHTLRHWYLMTNYYNPSTTIDIGNHEFVIINGNLLN